MSNFSLFFIHPSSHVCWVNTTGQGCTLPYPAISLHAVSKDISSFPHPCLYLMVDGLLMGEIQEVTKEGGGEGDASTEDRTEEEEREMGAVREVRFVPDNADACKFVLSLEKFLRRLRSNVWCISVSRSRNLLQHCLGAICNVSYKVCTRLKNYSSNNRSFDCLCVSLGNWYPKLVHFFTGIIKNQNMN